MALDAPPNAARAWTVIVGLVAFGCADPGGIDPSGADETQDTSSASGEGSESSGGDQGDEGGDPPEPGECVPWASAPRVINSPNPPLTFTDATAEAGIEHAYFAGEWPQGCPLEGDGTVAAPCKMHLQGGAAAVGDFDGDGLDDLFLTRLFARDLLYRNRGDGTFEELGASVGLDEVYDSNGAAFFDADRDGDLDLYVTTMSRNVVGRYFFYENVDGEFVENADERGLAFENADPHYGFSIGVGDYDRDGWPDLYLGEWWPNVPFEYSRQRLLRNLGPEGPGVFEDTTELAGADSLSASPPGAYSFAPAFVDLDEDGWQDLAIVADNGASRIFWNRRDGTFFDGTPHAGIGIEKNGMGSAFGDFDGDGHLDWFVTAIYNVADSSPEDCPTGECGRGGNRLYHSFAARCFRERATPELLRNDFWGWGTAFADFDNDRDLDIVATNGFKVPYGSPGFIHDAKPSRLWRRQGDAYVEEALTLGLSDFGQGRGLLVWDYDRDGDEDVLIVDNGSETRLWRNEGGSANDYLRVRVRSHSGLLEGQGVRVALREKPGSPLQVREIGAKTHFLGQSERVAHFGLGDALTEVAELHLWFPASGQSVHRYGINTRQELLIEEP